MRPAFFPGLLAAILLAHPGTFALAQSDAQSARAFVQKAVQNEMAKDQAEHSHWLYLEVDLKPDQKVLINTDTFEGYDQKYALGVIRTRVLETGARLVNDKAQADVIVDVRAGALSVDHNDLLVGIPSTQIPIPLAGALKTPEIAFFKRELDRGVAKFAITAYDSKTGKLETASSPAYGFSHRQNWTVLLFVSWSTDDTLPDGADS